MRHAQICRKRLPEIGVFIYIFRTLTFLIILSKNSVFVLIIKLFFYDCRLLFWADCRKAKKLFFITVGRKKSVGHGKATFWNHCPNNSSQNECPSEMLKLMPSCVKLQTINLRIKFWKVITLQLTRRILYNLFCVLISIYK